MIKKSELFAQAEISQLTPAEESTPVTTKEKPSVELPEIQNLSQMKKKLKPGMRYEILSHWKPERVGEIREITSVSTVGFVTQNIDETGERNGKHIHADFADFLKAKNWNFEDGVYTQLRNNGYQVFSFRLIDPADTLEKVAQKPEKEAAFRQAMLEANQENLRNCDENELMEKLAFRITGFGLDRISYRLFEKEYIDKYMPLNRSYGLGDITDERLHELARDFQNGTDIRAELAKEIFPDGTFVILEDNSIPAHTVHMRIHFEKNESGELSAYVEDEKNSDKEPAYKRNFTFESLGSTILKVAEKSFHEDEAWAKKEGYSSISAWRDFDSILPKNPKYYAAHFVEHEEEKTLTPEKNTPEATPATPQTYTYYSTQRPLMPGTFPKKQAAQDIVNFDEKKYCEEIGREAWGYVTYNEPLSAQEQENYELVSEKEEQEIEPKVSDLPFKVGDEITYAGHGNNEEQEWTVKNIEADRITLTRETGNIVMPIESVNTFLSEVVEYVNSHTGVENLEQVDTVERTTANKSPVNDVQEKAVEQLHSDEGIKAIDFMAAMGVNVVNMDEPEKVVANILPTITCEWSESGAFEDGRTYSIAEFDRRMREADETFVAGRNAAIAHYGSEKAWDDAELYGDKNDYKPFIGYRKVKFTLTMPNGDTYTERQDVGDNIGGVIDFLKQYAKYQENDVLPILEEVIRAENPEYYAAHFVEHEEEKTLTPEKNTPEATPATPQTYTYYSTQRPLMLGTFPKKTSCTEYCQFR